MVGNNIFKRIGKKQREELDLEIEEDIKSEQ